MLRVVCALAWLCVCVLFNPSPRIARKEKGVYYRGVAERQWLASADLGKRGEGG
jgi:hypothetical protein